MDRYANLEAFGIHLLTGALFALISALFLWHAAMHSIGLLAFTAALTAFAVYGRRIQATFFTPVLRGRIGPLARDAGAGEGIQG